MSAISNGSSFDALNDGNSMCFGGNNGHDGSYRPIGSPPSANWMFKATPVFRIWGMGMGMGMYGSGEAYGNGASDIGAVEGQIGDPDCPGTPPGVPPSAHWAPTGPLIWRI